MSEVIFKNDMKKIEKACIENPLGSYQIGEIARLSGLLQENGIDTIKLLKLTCINHGIEF